MTCSFLVSSLLLLGSGIGWANEEEYPPSGGESSASSDVAEDDTPSEEIIVQGEMEIARKRTKVVQNLKHLGYREAKRKDGRSILRPSIPYRPTVVLDDDAWMHVKRSPVRIDPPGKKDNKLRYLWCLPPFTITAACIQVGGQVIAERKLAHFKDDIARATDFEMRQWRNAIVAHAMDKRLGEDIPDMLDRIWDEGKTLATEEVLLLDPVDRRAAILAFWSNRACVPEGEAVRRVVADFIIEIIQHSSHPAVLSEISQANQFQRCSDAEPLPIPSQATP